MLRQFLLLARFSHLGLIGDGIAGVNDDFITLVQAGLDRSVGFVLSTDFDWFHDGQTVLDREDVPVTLVSK